MSKNLNFFKSSLCLKEFRSIHQVASFVFTTKVTTSNLHTFQNEGKCNLQVGCINGTIRHQIKHFDQHVRIQRIHCIVRDFLSPIVHLRVYEEVFACFEFLQAIVIYFSQLIFNIKTCCYWSTFSPTNIFFSVQPQRIKIVKVLTRSVTQVNSLWFDCGKDLEHMNAQINPGVGRKTWTMGTLQGSSWTSLLLLSIIASCSMCSTPLKRKLFCVWDKAFQQKQFDPIIWNKRKEYSNFTIVGEKWR